MRLAAIKIKERREKGVIGVFTTTIYINPLEVVAIVGEAEKVITLKAQPGDKHPFRAPLAMAGEDAVAEINEALNWPNSPPVVSVGINDEVQAKVFGSVINE